MRNTFFTLAIFSFIFVIGFVFQPCSSEAAGEFGIGGKVSSLGVGGEIVGNVMDNLNLRAGVQGIAYDYDDTYAGNDYEAELEFFSGMLLADYFPLSNNFRITGGIMLNQNEVTLDAIPTNGTYNVGGYTYPAYLVGSLKGTIDFNTVAPYLGLGYGGHFGNSDNWGFFMDIGILFQGSPNIEYTATGPIANDPTFQARLEQERLDLEEDIDEYEYYPVISMGVIYRF